MTRLLPDGTTTRSVKKYLAAWDRIAEPVCAALGVNTHAFGPGMQFREATNARCVMVAEADKPILLLVRRMWDMLTDEQRAALKAEGDAVRQRLKDRAAEYAEEGRRLSAYLARCLDCAPDV